MAGPALDEIEKYAQLVSSPELYAKKLGNIRQFGVDFEAKNEVCGGLPLQIHVEPAGECNLYCPICPRGRGKIQRRGFLSFAAFREVFDPFAETLVNIVISGFGEPLLNPETPRMIAHASDQSAATLLNTNGTVLFDQVDALLDSRLTSINVSLDGATVKSCHPYNPAYPFTEVVKGVERLSERKRQGSYRFPEIIGQFIIRDDEDEAIERLRDWALGLGVEQVKFKRMHTTMPGEIERTRAAPPAELTRLSNNNETYSTELIHWSQYDCSHPWDSFFLGCTGEMGLCSFDPYMTMKLPADPTDITRTWNCENVRKVRRWHAQRGEKVQEPCLKCNRLPGNYWARTAN